MSSDHNSVTHFYSNHSHPGIGKSRSRRMLWAIGITGSILVVEAIGGILSGSLALLSDAGHMLTDLASLLITLAAMVLAARPASAKHTFGYARLEVLAALGNAFTFFLMVIGVGWEAFQRLAHPALPHWQTMGVIAFIGLLANVLSAWFLRGAHEDDLNMKSAWVHVMGDLVSSVGVLVGVAVIALKGWTWVDPVLSLFIACLIAVSAFKLFWKALHILLESAPRGLTQERIREFLIGEIPEIKEVHHVHLWEVGSGEIHLTAHLVVGDRLLSEGIPIVARAAESLKKKFSISHSTLQLETPTRLPVIGPLDPK
jgi:cobalt-zinc-cadmium efflux system protein